MEHTREYNNMTIWKHAMGLKITYNLKLDLMAPSKKHPLCRLVFAGIITSKNEDGSSKRQGLLKFFPDSIEIESLMIMLKSDGVMEFVGKTDDKMRNMKISQSNGEITIELYGTNLEENGIDSNGKPLTKFSMKKTLTGDDAISFRLALKKFMMVAEKVETHYLGNMLISKANEKYENRDEVQETE
jgi:hypothetical protein